MVEQVACINKDKISVARRRHFGEQAAGFLAKIDQCINTLGTISNNDKYSVEMYLDLDNRLAARLIL